MTMSEELQFHEQGEKIFVSIRLRPLNDKSRNRVCDWECINNDTIVFKHNLPERAIVFDSDCDTALVYEEGAKHIALSVLDGINSSIFAYGQTSSGKTYTMRGITEYAVSDIYDYIENNEEREFLVKFCAMEIYNEAVRDLLSPDSYPLRVLDDPERGTVVEKLTEVTLRNREHLHELLSICEAQRQIGETSLNETSSRSHQILRLTIESCAREYAGARNSSILEASVNFVDLAGSERASQTLTAGARLKEGCHINRSLLTLGTVIRKLSKGRTGHIPYRDSKLTRILQNALGGNARTAIICTMSPERVHVEQSKNTLVFANCAKQVRTNAQVNLVMSDKALVKQLQRELARLEKEMRNLGSSSVKGDTATMAKEIEELTWQRDLAQSRVENLLLSVKEVQMLKQSSNSSEVAKVPYMADSNKHKDTVATSVPSDNNGYPALAEDPEENFLLDGMTPKFIGPDPSKGYPGLPEDPEEDFLLDGLTPKFIGPDPSKGWEFSEQMGQEFKDSSKEVQCVEIEDSKNTMNEQEEKLTLTEVLPKETGADEGDDFSTDTEKKQGKLDMITTTNDSVVTSQEKEDLQPSYVYSDQTYKDLKQKIQELQRTVKFLVSIQHLDQSPSFSDICSPIRSLSRSKSCRAVIRTAPSSPSFEKAAHKKADPLPVGHSRASSVSSGSVDTLSLKDLDVENTLSATNFLPPQWKSISEDPLRRISNSTDLAACGSEMTQQSEKQIENKMKLFHPAFQRRSFRFLVFGDGAQTIHASKEHVVRYSFQDPIEHKRITFIRFIFNAMQIAARDIVFSLPGDSEKELTRERLTLSKQIRYKWSRKQREEVYKKWGIDLNTKQRSVQLAHLVWKDPKDIVHVKESAALVAEVLGFVEPSRAPNEGVAFCMLPRFLSRRSHSWRLSLPSLF
ncbi:Kinesin-like protein NACK1 [Hibiscus syriacus]|uniref:Kinesin-like protein n=1 Tax=Hibiscus syriacus TaxID=106335 RepID=A0A6A3B8J6_HIBSY|nr:Kinesin-like protein NACK1 [Hibiscus syriacus]